MKFTTSLAIESWTLFVLGILVVVCRMLARRMKLGAWSKLGFEDYAMLFVVVNFTGVTVSINEVAKNGSNYMPAEEAANLEPEEVDQAIFGSKMTFVLEIFSLTGLWMIKGCLLWLYHRLTVRTHSKQHLMVKIVAGYCVVTYLVVTFMFVFYWCHPTYEYWAVPVRIEQCATYYHHMIFATACNISSDILLFCIPIPIILKLQLSVKRKVILCCILGLGVFNILAAVLNRYYNFNNPNSYVFLYWYVAEFGIAMYVANLPLCWPLVRMALGSKGSSSTPSYPYNYRDQSTHGVKSGKTWSKLDPQSERIDSDQDSQIELVGQKNALGQAATTAHTSSASHAQGQNTATGGDSSEQDKIMVVTTVDVSTGDK